MSILEVPLHNQNDSSRHIKVFSAVYKRPNSKSNIWFFDSPKNNRRLKIAGDVRFMHLVILEGDVAVSGYDPEPQSLPDRTVDNLSSARWDAKIHYKDGHSEFWKFLSLHEPDTSRSERTKLLKAQEEVNASGNKCRIRTDEELRHKGIFFDNWLTLCAGITRCRNQSLDREATILLQRLSLQEFVSFDTLLDVPGIDPAIMLAVVALSLQSGVVETELEKTLFGPNSTLRKKTK